MHELSITQSIVEACCERATGTRVLRVTLQMDDLLSSCTCGSVNLEPPLGGDQLRIKSMEIEEAA